MGSVAPLDLGHTGSDVFRGLCQNVAWGARGQVSHGVAGYGHKQILQRAFDKLMTGHPNPLPRPCLQVLDPRTTACLTSLQDASCASPGLDFGLSHVTDSGQWDVSRTSWGSEACSLVPWLVPWSLEDERMESLASVLLHEAGLCQLSPQMMCVQP